MRLFLILFLTICTGFPAFAAIDNNTEQTSFSPQILKLQIQKTTPTEQKKAPDNQEDEIKAEIQQPVTFKAKAWKFAKGKKQDDSLILGMQSHHFGVTNRHDFNEKNNMYGVEYKGYTASTFKNSFNEQSYFAGITRKVWEKKFNKYVGVDLQYKAGALYGYGSRYPNLGGVTPVVLPYIGFNFMKVGFDLLVIPSNRPILAGSFRIGIPKL
jgi:hypothetical protein